MVLGKCQSCGRTVSSASLRLCANCAKEQKVCGMCLKPQQNPKDYLCPSCQKAPRLH